MGVRNPSPSFPFLANLFGQGYELNKRGGFKLTGETGGGLFGEQALGDISAYLRGNSANPYTSAFNAINQGGMGGNFASMLPAELSQPYQQATTGIDDLIGRARPVLASLIETGNPVDVSGVVQNRYANTILPTAAEQYNPASGSAFQNIAAREAANLIAELEYPAQEAARQRQENALNVGAPTFAALNAQRLGLPAAVLGEASTISQLSDPGGRLMSALLGLLGYTQQASMAFDRPGTGGSGTGELLGSIGSLVGGLGGASTLCWVADELFGEDDLRTTLARAWCHAHPDDPFVMRYATDGREWARMVRDDPAIAEALQPLWELLALRGAYMLVG